MEKDLLNDFCSGLAWMHITEKDQNLIVHISNLIKEKSNLNIRFCLEEELSSEAPLHKYMKNGEVWFRYTTGVMWYSGNDPTGDDYSGEAPPMPIYDIGEFLPENICSKSCITINEDEFLELLNY